MEEINERFFELRTALKLTQSEIGEVLGMKKAAV